MTSLFQKAFVIDTRNVQKALSIYRTINDWLRLQIIEMIQKAGAIDTPLMLQTLRPKPSVGSAHSKLVRDAKNVIGKRKGNYVF
ncbi:MAG: hypothetical protein J7502_12075 [Flavisolibacter sp.]|nr:hypothetical protein [Flavisolibacter sp.]